MAIRCTECGTVLSNPEAVDLLGRERFDDFVPRVMSAHAIPFSVVARVGNDVGMPCPNCSTEAGWDIPEARDDAS